MNGSHHLLKTKYSIKEMLPKAFINHFPIIRTQRECIIVREFNKAFGTQTFENPTELSLQVKDVPVNIRERYVPVYFQNLKSYQKGKKRKVLERKQVSFSDYIQRATAEKAPHLLINETLTPSCLLESFNFKPLGINDFGTLYEKDPNRLDLAWSFIYCAGANSASDLHTDWDGTDILLYQSLGKKRMVVFPTESAEKLAPSMIFSSIKVSELWGDDLEKLLAYTDGQVAILNPGDAIYMPVFYWHHADYLDFGLSINFRLNRDYNDKHRALFSLLHQDYLTQQIHLKLILEKDESLKNQCINHLLEELNKNYKSSFEKYKKMKAQARQVLLQLDPGFLEKSFIHSEDFLEQTLSAVYSLPNQTFNQMRKKYWSLKDSLYEKIRRKALAITHKI